MRKQKFFNITLIYDFDHDLDRGLLQSWLQHFLCTDLKGRDLAGLLNGGKDVQLHVKESERPRNSYVWLSASEIEDNEGKPIPWYTEQYVVTRIALRPCDFLHYFTGKKI